ncbi:MAG: hypothetical protein GF370_03960 [Candidatus Nealsonbacteria bacterium]|nr:hypothetical protein [Candidatus Nealsonbacteria bacterium]
MEPIISKAEAEETKNLEGEVLGDVIRTKALYVLERKGEHGVEKLEQAVREAGYSVDYNKLDRMKFYPVGLEVATLLAMERIFELGDEDFREMGAIEAKLTTLMRFFMRYFVSLDRVAKEAPGMWRKVYTVGELKVTEINEEENYMKVRLEDFPFTPILCRAHEGWFAELIHVVLNKDVSCQEIKCNFKGDDYHEFIVRW